MPQNPLSVSIIIPTYQQSENLGKCLTALTRQTIKKFQTIICDDGSTDDTHQICKKFMDKLDLVYVRQEHDGMRRASVRNLALPHAKGDLLVFIDADMMCPIDFIKEHVNAHKDCVNEGGSSNRLVMGGRQNVDLEGGQVFKDFRLEARWKDKHSRIWEYMGGSNFSIMRDDMKRVGVFDTGYDGSWGFEDTDLAYRAHDIGLELVFKPEIMASHLHHEVADKYSDTKNKKYFFSKHGLKELS